MSYFEQLARPFNVEQIHWRVGATNAKKLGVKPWEATSGIALAYLNARDVMERLDEVVGPENWQDRYPYPGCCELSLRINGEWITKSDAAGETEVEGIKGQSSDAFKRAAVKFKVGRYLYDLPNTWVELKNGKIIQPPKLPTWALPPVYTKEEKATYDTLLNGEDHLAFWIYTNGLSDDVQKALHNSFPKGEITKNKNKAREHETKGSKMFAEYKAGIELAIKEEDYGSILELTDELTDNEKAYLFKHLTPEERETVKKLKEAQ